MYFTSEANTGIYLEVSHYSTYHLQCTIKLDRYVMSSTVCIGCIPLCFYLATKRNINTFCFIITLIQILTHTDRQNLRTHTFAQRYPWFCLLKVSTLCHRLLLPPGFRIKLSRSKVRTMSNFNDRVPGSTTGTTYVLVNKHWCRYYIMNIHRMFWSCASE